MKEILSQFIEWVQAYGVLGLAILSFAESSFFPIPPDVLLIPMAILNQKLAIFYALITTAASVLGGMFGHLIGDRLGKPILHKFFKEDTLKKVEKYFEEKGGWAVAIAGFTPIPYKVFTISAGVFRVKMSTLIIASIIGRGARFFLEGIIIYIFGQTAKYYLTHYFEWVTLGVTAVCILGYFVYKNIITPSTKTN